MRRLLILIVPDQIIEIKENISLQNHHPPKSNDKKRSSHFVPRGFSLSSIITEYNKWSEKKIRAQKNK
jgi:hypothetical protein